jgi:hypothetical protein
VGVEAFLAFMMAAQQLERLLLDTHVGHFKTSSHPVYNGSLFNLLLDKAECREPSIDRYQIEAKSLYPNLKQLILVEQGGWDIESLLQYLRKRRNNVDGCSTETA